ncbi:MAG: NUDIX hydrolase [Clostridiales bacterium]|jgi:8-oxo-dGTP pyrophosphatase MutT (NUDIX family)|nr:NUDIX hydrolase [Clostridiales bacterium]
MEKNIISCGGVVVFKNRVLALYKNQNGRYMGWVLPKGNVEPNETHKQAALREVKEESGVSARIMKYLGKTQYSFNAPDSDLISKTVHWYLMTTNSFHCKPQAEEFFADAGFYKQHEAYHLLKFHDERQIMRQAFLEYEKVQRFKKIKIIEGMDAQWKN